MKMERHDFNSMDEIPEGYWYNDNIVTVVHEKGWFKADMTTTCKSAETAINRFFKALPEVGEIWKDMMKELAKFGDKDIGVYYEVDCSNSDDDLYYIFLNIDQAGRGGLD